MNKYLFDSNTVSSFYDKFSAGYHKISNKLLSLNDVDSVSITILTLYEMEYGYANAPEKMKNILRQKIKEVQQDFHILSLSADSAKLFGELKKSLKNSKRLKKENIKKHNIDIMIAATAINENCILVSNDAIYRDIKKIYDFKYEDWIP